MTPPARRPLRGTTLALLCSCAAALPAAGQVQGAPFPTVAPSPPAPAVAPARGPNVSAWTAGLVLGGGLVAVVALDRPVRRLATSGSSASLTSATSALQRFGEPQLTAAVASGLALTGLALGKPEVARSGLRVAGAVGLATVVSQLAKGVSGRLRPDGPGDGDEFEPFTFADRSFPSGHTAAAFALATTLADDIRHPAATVGLYGLAAATGLARIQQNRHWTSDVLIGAALGVASAKFINGRWSLFGLRAPSFFVGPGGGMGLQVQATF
jgi:membrane-associated phospholipid phosphatase